MCFLRHVIEIKVENLREIIVTPCYLIEMIIVTELSYSRSLDMDYINLSVILVTLSVFDDHLTMISHLFFKIDIFLTV